MKNGCFTKDPFTPPETNMSPENRQLEDVFPIEIAPFQGTCASPRCGCKQSEPKIFGPVDGGEFDGDLHWYNP